MTMTLIKFLSIYFILLYFQRTGSPPTASGSEFNRTYNVPKKEKERSINETLDSGKPQV